MLLEIFVDFDLINVFYRLWVNGLEWILRDVWILSGRLLREWHKPRRWRKSSRIGTWPCKMTPRNYKDVFWIPKLSFWGNRSLTSYRMRTGLTVSTHFCEYVQCLAKKLDFCVFSYKITCTQIRDFKWDVHITIF